jgi:hypothetical protein
MGKEAGWAPELVSALWRRETCQPLQGTAVNAYTSQCHDRSTRLRITESTPVTIPREVFRHFLHTLPLLSPVFLCYRMMCRGWYFTVFHEEHTEILNRKPPPLLECTILQCFH